MNPISKVTETFGENLKHLRQEKKYTRKQLAEKIGVAAITLAGYETGIRAPSLEKLILIADFFRVSIDSLFERNEFLDIDFQKKNLEWRFERIEKLMTIWGLVIEEGLSRIMVPVKSAFSDSIIYEMVDSKEIWIYPDYNFFLAMDEFGGIDSRPEPFDYGEGFSDKETFVEFFETMERQSARKNKPLKEVFIKKTALKEIWDKLNNNADE